MESTSSSGGEINWLPLGSLSPISSSLPSLSPCLFHFPRSRFPSHSFLDLSHFIQSAVPHPLFRHSITRRLVCDSIACILDLNSENTVKIVCFASLVLRKFCISNAVYYLLLCDKPGVFVFHSFSISALDDVGGWDVCWLVSSARRKLEVRELLRVIYRPVGAAARGSLQILWSLIG